MKFLFRRSQPQNPTTNHQRRPSLGPRLSLLLLCASMVLTLGIGTTLSRAQGDGNLRKQEDQFIQKYTLPKTPTKAPVYKPKPRPRPRPAARPRPKAAPAAPPRRRSNPAPARVAPARPRPAARPQPRRTQSRSQSRPRSQPQSTPNPIASTPNIPLSEYILQFNRSPIVGNRLRMRGVYSEARLGFTRPRGWKVKTAKALIRFQHSPALIANRSNLTLRINGTSVASVPLNRKQSQVANVMFAIPTTLIQDYNELSLVAQQHNTTGCTDGGDATLWTEVLPDSKLIFQYQVEPIPLNFSRYPYPFFDQLSLDANRMAYMLPKGNVQTRSVDSLESWLTAAPRLQASLGRLADFRPITTRLVETIDELEWGDSLVVIGTPGDQPVLKSLALPFTFSGNQILDGNQIPLPDDVGVLALTTVNDGSNPVLVVTGNGPDGVKKAAQFLVQPDTSKLGTGQLIFVDQVRDVPIPSSRNWPGYLPEENSFTLEDIATQPNGKPFKDVTVRGTSAPPVEFNFRALPDDRFKRGSSMNLVYSYGPQVNPRTSAVEVLLDDVLIGGKRLTKRDGSQRETLKVDLPANLIKPTSKIKVAFRLNPREPEECGKIIDQHLTGTVHAETSFKVNREPSVQLPNLELLQVGYPFAAPQDLSNTAIVLSETPSDTDLLTLLSISERLGRLSKADSVQLDVYTIEQLPDQIRRKRNLVGIGTRDEFPFPEVFESKGLRLSNALGRQWGEASVQTLPDSEGVIKEIMSPYNNQRVLLALSGQTENGLDRVRQILTKDSWFYQLQKDTVLVSSYLQDPAGYDPDAYKLQFLELARSKKRIEKTSALSKASFFLQRNWWFLALGILGVTFLLYGISQLYLKRVTDQKSH
ncbi:MAG: cellulose biosynthesis cyclic di-GMP-binding regulatory protein BcsB [Moorea sp. SIO3G5]|nr:cellulose biosynthesis cyclic di-GMP-binding regulatory protein BcsB [Moorena sp. SIO3G5]